MRYHAKPGLGGALGQVNKGQLVNDLSRSQEADGILWNNVNIAGGTPNVWIDSEYLVFAHSGNC